MSVTSADGAEREALALRPKPRKGTSWPRRILHFCEAAAVLVGPRSERSFHHQNSDSECSRPVGGNSVDKLDRWLAAVLVAIDFVKIILIHVAIRRGIALNPANSFWAVLAARGAGPGAEGGTAAVVHGLPVALTSSSAAADRYARSHACSRSTGG